MRVNINFAAESAEEVLWTLRDLARGIADTSLPVSVGRSSDVWTERDGEVVLVGSMSVEEDR